MPTEYPYGQQTLKMPEWAVDRIIYEVNIRQYTQAGTFNAFREHLRRLKDMGVGVLWFMPIFPISFTKRKGSLGSYYSVSDFYKVNPEFGTETDFEELVREAHAFDLKVIIDWVPNHTGWDHKWLIEYPEFYSRNQEGDITEPLDGNGKPLGWSDVADLNYSNQHMRAEMAAAMQWWISRFDIDGFRQDMALLVPDEFWVETNQSLLKIKSDLFFLAESDNLELIDKKAFHVIYGWEFHHLLNAIATGKKSIQDLDNWCSKVYTEDGASPYLLFTSNHDENAWSGSEIERMGESHKAFAVLANTLPGMPLMYSGQEEPVSKRIAFFDKDTIDFQHFKNATFYSLLHQARKSCQALWNGPSGGLFERIDMGESIFAFRRTQNASSILVIINLTKIYRTFKVPVKFEGEDFFSGNHLLIQAGDAMTLKPWEYKVIKQSQ